MAGTHLGAITTVGDKAMTLMGRIVAVVSFAALVALLTIFAKPLWQGAAAAQCRFADIASR